ncbi:MAG TPA: DUF1571 domain-containing protein [Thermoguttaceae bacterium]|nr:DUF1571 domain-containing protein [Thermoguttaceae bacterium]
MILKAWFQRCFLFSVAVLWLCPALAQQSPYPTQPNNTPPAASQQTLPDYTQMPAAAALGASAASTPAQPNPQYQLAERSNPLPNPTGVSRDQRPGEHPLMPALRWATQGLQQMEQGVQDYSCIVFKRERQTDGTLGEEQQMFVKIRHKPFSVYMHFLKPDDLRGQEVIYVEGANEGKMLAHAVGMRSVFGTVPLKPTSPVAMKGQHYPITEMGMMKLIQRLLEVGNQDARYGECNVRFSEGGKVNDRVCTCIEVLHPVPRTNFRFHMARIFVDNEMNIPIRYEAHTWPRQAGGPPELIEEYTYLDIKVNRGFTDADFDVRNPNYGFKEGRQSRTSASPAAPRR